MSDILENTGVGESTKSERDAHYPSYSVSFVANALPEPDPLHFLLISLEPPEKAPSETSPNPRIKVERGRAFKEVLS